MRDYRFLVVLLISFLVTTLSAQQTTVYSEAYRSYKDGESLFEKNLFGKAQREFQKTVDLLLPVNEAESISLLTQAKLYLAKCAVRQELPDGEKLMQDFIRTYAPDPISNQALLELADFYFNAKEYDKAIEYLSKVPMANLNQAQRTEVRFKIGYSFFVKKQFQQAKSNFLQIKDINGDYYFPANYYLGLCYFFEGNYADALKSFKVVERSPQYRDHIPYYITQIYFAEGRYDELIAYAEPKISNSRLRNAKEMNQLVGQAYFEKQQYDKALPYLVYYADRTSKMREEEFYQLGFAQYKVGKYADAAKSFEQLAGVDSKLAQNALYTMGDAYLKVNNRANARNAFGAASRMDYDKDIKEEALFNFAKLSYELKFDQGAITALQNIPPTSKHYTEAQTLMSEVFLNTRDYERALAIIDALPNKTPALRETYQKVAFLRGLQLYNQGSPDQAKAFFNKSLEIPVDASTRAQAMFWLGEIEHQAKNFDASIRQMSQFMTLAKTLNNLPDEASIHTANYTQGYNYLKQKNYSSALGYFQESVAGIKRNAAFINSKYIKNNVLGDAILRAGDCLFKRNQYNDAIKFYDEAISQRYSGFIYALYQKAIIEGLRGRTTEKILALERIVADYPKSDYTDEALLQLGLTYQEINQFGRAVEPLKKLVAEFKNKSNLVNRALIQLGLISYNQGSTEQAINYYKQVFSNNPTPEEGRDALTALEEIYVKDLGRPDEYFAFLETIPGYKVDNLAKDSINFRAAEAQFEAGNYDRAVTAYTNYINRYPNGNYKLQAYYNRGESYSVLKDYTNALKDYEFVVNQGSSRYYLKALNKAAIIAYNHAQAFQKAYDLYLKLEQAADSDDMRFEAQLGAMRSAYRMNNTQAVSETARKVASNPNATPDQVATANFYIGKIAFDRKEYDNALSAFNQVTRLSDNEQTAEARYLIAYTYYLRRDLNMAQQLCINANKESSAYPYWVAKSVILLSDILVEKGDLLNARAALEALLENYDGDAELVQTAKNKLDQLNKQLEKSSRLNLNRNPGTLELLDENQN